MSRIQGMGKAGNRVDHRHRDGGLPRRDRVTIHSVPPIMVVTTFVITGIAGWAFGHVDRCDFGVRGRGIAGRVTS